MMQALSVIQPYAALLMIGADAGGKGVETRTRDTSFRGLVAIHASARFPRVYRSLCWKDPFARVLIDGGFAQAEELPLGAIIGVAELVGSHRVETLTENWEARGEIDTLMREHAFGDFSAGRWGRVVRAPRRLERPIPHKGALGFWKVDPLVEAQILEQIGKAVA